MAGVAWKATSAAGVPLNKTITTKGIIMSASPESPVLPLPPMKYIPRTWGSLGPSETSTETVDHLQNELDMLESKYGARPVRAANLTDPIERERASTAGETYFSDRMAAYLALKNELTILRGRYGTANVEAAMQAREVRPGWFSRVWDYVKSKADSAREYVRRIGPVKAATEAIQNIVQWTSIVLALTKAVRGLAAAAMMLFGGFKLA